MPGASWCIGCRPSGDRDGLRRSRSFPYRGLDFLPAVVFILEEGKEIANMSNDPAPASTPIQPDRRGQHRLCLSLPNPAVLRAATSEVASLLRELLSAQDRQNELLEELVSQLAAAQRQRASRDRPVETGQPASGQQLPHRPPKP